MRGLLLAAAAALGLAGCAGIADRTGITIEQQACLMNAARGMQNDPAYADWTYAQKAAFAAELCDIAPDAPLPAEVTGMLGA